MDQVGHYQITAELHRGVHGVVYRARDTNDGRTVALKAIPLRDAESSTLPLVLAALPSLLHPNIVPVFESLVQNGFAFIATEYVDAMSFAAALQQAQVRGYESLLLYLRQVAAALDFAHRKGVVHGDLKAYDILLPVRSGEGLDGSARVVGFGERALAEGTMGDPGRDQLALAELAHQSLTGQHATVGEEVSSALSPTVAKVLQRALAVNAQDRFQTASDFVGALGIALSEGSATHAQPALRPAPPGATTALLAGKSPVPASASAAAAAVAPTPAVAAPPLPAMPERRDRTTQIRRERTPILKSVAFLVFLCFLAAAALIFMVRMNSGQPVPVQVLETKSAPQTPAPTATTGASPTVTPAPPSGGSIPESVTAKPSTPALSSPAESRIAQGDAAPKGDGAPQIVRAQTRSQTQPQAQPNQTGPGIADVDLVSDPPGAKLVVDARADATCTAPCTMSLPAGRHTLTAQLSSYTVARRIFNIPDTNRLLITLTAENGKVLVTSTPAGASIFIDGKSFGATPATLNLPAGLHTLLLFSGSRQHEESLQVQPDTFQARAIHW